MSIFFGGGRGGVLFSETQTSLNFHFDSCEDGVRGLKLSAVLITLELEPYNTQLNEVGRQVS